MKTNQNDNDINFSINEFVIILEELGSTKDWRENLKMMIPKICSELFDGEIPVKYRVDEDPQKEDYLLSVKSYNRK